jgi:hypothetical protein
MLHGIDLRDHCHTSKKKNFVMVIVIVIDFHDHRHFHDLRTARKGTFST